MSKPFDLAAFKAAIAPPAQGASPFDDAFSPYQSPRLPEPPPPPPPGDVAAGFKTALGQTPALAKGVVGAIGGALEQFFGEGGISTGLKNWGIEGYQTGMQELTEKYSQPNHDVTVAWEKAKEGDVGALVDFVQYAFGYGLAQIGESAAMALAGSILGGVAGGAAAPATAVAGAAAGVVKKGAIKSLAERWVTNAVAETVAKSGGKIGVKAAAKQLGARWGSTAGLAAFGITQELGSIYPEAELHAAAEGRKLTAGEVAKAWGMGIVAGLTETAADRFQLDAMLGRSGAMRAAFGKMGAIKRGAIGGLVGTAVESGTELLQTGMEQIGAGKPLFSPEANREYINAAAMAAVPGLGGGVVGGVMSRQRAPQTPPPSGPLTDGEIVTEIGRASSVDEAIAIAGALTETGAPMTEAQLLSERALMSKAAEEAQTFLRDRDWAALEAAQAAQTGEEVSQAFDARERRLGAVEEAQRGVEQEGMIAARGEQALEQELAAAKAAGMEQPAGPTAMGLAMETPGKLKAPPKSTQAKGSVLEQAGANAAPLQAAPATPATPAAPDDVVFSREREPGVQSLQAPGKPGASGYWTAAPGVENDAAAVEGLNRALAVEAQGRGAPAPTGWQQVDVGTLPVDDTPLPGSPVGAMARSQESVRLAQNIAGLFGKRVVPIRNLDAKPGDFMGGTVVGGDTERVFLNVDSPDASPVTIVGHETYHQMEVDAPDLAVGVRRAIGLEGKRAIDAGHPLVAFYRYYEGGANLTDDQVVAELGKPEVLERMKREVAADFFGNRAGEYTTLKTIFKAVGDSKDKGLIYKVASYIVQAIDAILRRVKTQKFEVSDQLVSKLVKDLEGAKQVARDAMAEYAKRQGMTKMQAEAAMREAMVERAKAAAQPKPRLDKNRIPILSKQRTEVRQFASTGKLVGAPPGKATVADRDALVKRLYKSMLSKNAVFDESHLWYEKSGDMIRALSGRDETLMESVVRLFALYSQSNSIQGNVTAVVKSLVELARSPTAHAGRFPNTTAELIPQVLIAEEFDKSLPGINDKVLSFYQNLHDATFRSDKYAQESTQDRWMMRLMGYPHAEDDNGDVAGSTGFSPTQYAYARDVTIRVADEYNRTHPGAALLPRQVQAALWSWVKNEKAEQEQKQALKEVELAIKALKKLDPKELVQPGKPKTVADALKALTKRRDEIAKFEPQNMNFADVVDRVTAAVTWEAAPGMTSGRPLPGSVPSDVRRAYTRAMLQLIVDEKGNDSLLELLGGGTALYRSTMETGAFEGKINPNVVTAIVLAGGKASLDTAIADTYAAALAILFRQDAYAWHRADPTLTGKEASVGLSISFPGTEITEDFEERFFQHLRGSVDKDVGYSRLHHGDEVVFRLVNFRDKKTGKPFGMPDKAFEAKIEAALNAFDTPSTVVKFKAQSEYVTNDWQANPNGEGYQARVGEAYRSRVQDWLGRLRPAADAVHEGFARQHGWPAPGLAKSGQRSGSGRVEAARGWSSRPAQAQAAEVTGIHYGRERTPVLSGSKYGTGIRGAEAARLAQATDPRIKRRIYFYVADGETLPRPEANLGLHTYTQKFTNLYDVSKVDTRFPSGLDANGFESAVLDLGYDGYVNRARGMLVVLDADVPVEYLGERTAASRTVADLTPPVLSLSTERVQAVLDGKDNRPRIGLSVKTPPAFLAAGFQQRPLTISRSVIEKLGSGAQGQRAALTAAEIADLPAGMWNPIAIFDFDRGGDRDTANVLFMRGDEMWLAGVARDLNAGSYVVNELLTAFAPTVTPARLAGLNRDMTGRIRYVDRERVFALPARIRDYSPALTQAARNPGKSVATPARMVNRANREAGVRDLPRAKPLSLEAFGFQRSTQREAAGISKSAQRATERTEFKLWARGAPVVSANDQAILQTGKRVVIADLLHGSPWAARITSFDRNAIGSGRYGAASNNVIGWHLTDDPSTATDYALLLGKADVRDGDRETILVKDQFTKSGAGLIKAFVRLDNPLVMRGATYSRYFIEGKPERVEALVRYMDENKHDGLIIDFTSTEPAVVEKEAFIKAYEAVSDELLDARDQLTKEEISDVRVAEGEFESWSRSSSMEPLPKWVRDQFTFLLGRDIFPSDDFIFKSAEQRHLSRQMVARTKTGEYLAIGVTQSFHNPGTAYADSLWVVVRPQAADQGKIKSVNNNGQFTDNPDIYKSAQRGLGFYSELHKRIEAMPTKSAPANAWKDTIRALKGIKPEEIEWSGVNDWLDMRTTKNPAQGELFGTTRVTKEELLSYLERSGPYVKETTLAGTSPNVRSEEDGMVVDTEWLTEEGERRGPDTRRIITYEFPDGARYTFEGSTTDGFDVYGPEGESITGDRVSLFEAKAEAWSDWSSAADGNVGPESDGPTKFDNWTLPDGKNYRELLVQLDRVSDPLFKGDHWGQGDVLGHVRVKDRVSMDRQNVLFLEEIQSDWAEEGREKGFAEQTYYVLDEFGNRVAENLTTREEAEVIVNERGELEVVAEPPVNKVAKGPFVQRTEGWVSLMLKRMIGYAVEHGHDAIAWSSGEQNAERYGLQKVVKNIAWAQGDLVNIQLVSGGDVVFRVDTEGNAYNYYGPPQLKLEGRPLTSIVGKKLADQIMASDNGEVSGEGLRLGGEGMRTFYDVMVPNIANEILRKLKADTKVKTITFQDLDVYEVRPLPDDEWGVYNRSATTAYANSVTARFRERPAGDGRVAVYKSEEEAIAAAKEMTDLLKARMVGDQMGFEITPRLRELAAKGLPLFSKQRAIAAANPNFRRWSNEAPVVLATESLDYKFETGEPFVAQTYHGTNASEFVDLPGGTRRENAVDFTAFSLDEGGMMTGADSAAMGIFSTSEPDVASSYAQNIGMGRSLGLALGGAKSYIDVTPEIQALDAEMRELRRKSTLAWDDGLMRLRASKHAEVVADPDFKEFIKKDIFKGTHMPPSGIEGVMWMQDLYRKYNGDPVYRRGLTADDKEVVYIQMLDVWLRRGEADWTAVPEFEEYHKAELALRETEEKLSELINAQLQLSMPQRIMPLWVKMSNPKVYNAEGKSPAEFAISEKIASAKREGHDGVVFQNIMDPSPPSTHFVAFKSEQLKSVFNETFDDTGELSKSAQRTPEFRRWFGDSKVVDENGEPEVQYHSTVYDFSEFNEYGTLGAHFGTRPAALERLNDIGARREAKDRVPDSRIPLGSNVMPVYLRIEKPLRLKDVGNWADALSIALRLRVMFGLSKSTRQQMIELAETLEESQTLYERTELTGDEGFVDQEGNPIPAPDWATPWTLSPENMDALVEIRQALESEGFDGIVYKNEVEDAGVDSYIVFRSDQVKSAIGNRGTFDPTNPDITKSAPRISIGDLTPEQQATAERVGAIVEPVTWQQRWDTFKQDLGLRIQQGVFDQFAPIAKLDYEAYQLARLSKGSDGTLEASVLYGRPFMQDGVPNVDINDRGFADVIATLADDTDRFFWWVAAQRARQLKAQGKENLFSDADITAFETLNLPDAKHPDRRQKFSAALARLNEFNEAMLKIARDSELIDDDAYTLFKDQPYVPFYRVMEDEGGVRGPGFGKGLVNQYAWKKLKGGTEVLNQDLLSNLLQNWAHLLSASAKNRAAVATAVAAIPLGVIEQVPSGTPKAVRMRVQGKEQHFIIHDPHLHAAIGAITYATPGWFKPFSTVKRALTIGVTANPAFKIRNLIRDSVQSIATGQLDPNPIKNVMQGWKAASPKSQTYASMLASGGMIRYGASHEGERSSAVRLAGKKRIDPATILDESGWAALQRKLVALYDAYEELSDKSENINRNALYEQLIAKGYSHREASFMARDLMDFSMGGMWPVVRFLAQSVPFLNARLQGLYKLGKSAKDDPTRVGYTVGAVILASMVPLLMYGDDDDWKRREDWDRDNYWWFKIGDQAYRIPKPFEIGAIGTLAERTWELAFSKEMSGARYGRRIVDAIAEQFSMNPTPQIIKPIVDLYANRDAFTGRAIESMGMERKLPEDRARAGTSTIALALGQLGLPNPAQLANARYEALSPVQIDHLIRAYFGWLGSVTVAAVDYGLRPMTDRGPRPEMKLKDVFIAGGFVETLPPNSSRYVSQMYEQARQAEQYYASYRDALKYGDRERAAEIMSENRDKLVQYQRLKGYAEGVSQLSEQTRRIEASRSLSPETKRKMIDALEQRKHELARRAPVQ